MSEVGWVDNTMGSLDARPPEESSFPGHFHSGAASVTELRVREGICHMPLGIKRLQRVLAL